jgi:hypothetical protein
VANPNLWTFAQLDAIEEVKALVTEIRRLNVIVTRAGGAVTHLDPMLDRMPSLARYAVLGLREVLEAPATGRPEEGGSLGD